MNVPFFRPSISEEAIAEVTECLRSGWLTTGPRTKTFEQRFAEKVGARHAIALNSCTAALHLALDAVGVRSHADGPSDMVIVPTFTFAATAEVVRYFDATPVFVDCVDDTLCIDVDKARTTLQALRDGRPVAGLKPPYGKVKAIIPMHYAGQMADVDAVRTLAQDFDLAIIEDAAHCVPAYAKGEGDTWRSVGTTADITCFSFYANKCITTGEGGMAVTDDDALADRMRVMSLHGMNKDAWRRFDTNASWYYEIVAPGFKYNLTDIASSIGLHQLRRSDELWAERIRLAARYKAKLADVTALRLLEEKADRKSSWHLFPIRVQSTSKLNRGDLIEALKAAGVGTSVHWMPLHMQPYYTELYGFERDLFPVAAHTYDQLVSLPLFVGMSDDEQDYVCATLKRLVEQGA